MSDWSGRRLHFIAIGGAGMSGLALIARALGAEVSGSDRAESSYMQRLRNAGLDPRLGHDAAAVPADAEVVVSTAIGDDNPELAVARERGQRVIHRGELLAEVCEAKRLLAVAGTHGKTTTTAMAAFCLRAAGADPAFVLGGELPGAGPGGTAANAAWGGGEWIVAEADESDASFLQLRPEVAVVTNVELDHHSFWRSRAELLDAFGRFLEPAAATALLADPGFDDLVPAGRAIRFGIDPGRDPAGPTLRRPAPDLVASPDPDRAGVDLSLPGGGAARLELAVPGEHNLLNALAALAALHLAGADVAAAAAALSSFPGVARRLELKGRRDGAVIYDDYAHHPTEVEAALRTARDLAPGRLIAVFQPHLYSRTKALAPEFGAALALADEVAVLDVYPAREEPVGELEGVSGRLVAEAAADRSGGRRVWWLPDAAQAQRALADRLGDGDVLVTLGAGDIFRLAEALVGE
jgi:UDP-N-acetylmuramate--alanine ligase